MRIVGQNKTKACVLCDDCLKLLSIQDSENGETLSKKYVQCYDEEHNTEWDFCTDCWKFRQETVKDEYNRR